MNNYNVQVVIPTLNRKQITIKCVEKLLKGTYLNFNIIICDSGSTDGTQNEFINYKNIEYLNVGRNKWWSGAINSGIKKALEYNPDFILIINDDIDFSNTLIEDLLRDYHKNIHSIISPLQKTNKGFYVGIRYEGLFKIPRMIFLNKDIKEFTSVESSNGCCLFMPSEIFSVVGFIDENSCPHLAGDAEFQIRARKNGFKTIVSSNIKILQGDSTDYYSRVKLKNMFTFYGSPVHFPSYWKFGVTLFGSNLNFIIIGVSYHFNYLKSVTKTILFIVKKQFNK